MVHIEMGPFEGFVPPMRFISGLLGCLGGAAIGIVGICRNRGRWLLIGYVVFIAASAVWLTGHIR